ncbi:MAG: hypothetical protein HYV35_00260 [Lentisphaerae bacterium]|nr:hypothetical protein [Lentisphaerota bacterium]
MNSKSRMQAVLEGRSVDRVPVAVPYIQLYHTDHFAELSGQSALMLEGWLYAPPEEHLAVLKRMIAQAPFDIVQPQPAPSAAEREAIEWIEKEGKLWRRDKRTGAIQPVAGRAAGQHAFEYQANETQKVCSRLDAAERVRPVKAEAIRASGVTDYAEAAVRALGAEHFIMPAGNAGILWGLSDYLGQTNMLAMLADPPDFLDYLSEKIMEGLIEHIRAWCSLGADAYYIDDAMSYSDIISVEHYERYSLPYVKTMVQEIQRLNHKAILIYFGGVADRLEQIVSTGADGLIVETSMKSYVNDIERIASAVGQRITIFGNIDPVGILEKADDATLRKEMDRQAMAGRRARGFVMSTGSPITPGTPLKRVRQFIEWGARPA